MNLFFVHGRKQLEIILVRGKHREKAGNSSCTPTTGEGLPQCRRGGAHDAWPVPPDSSLAFCSRRCRVTAQLCPLQPRTDPEQGDDGTWPSLTGNGGSQPLGSMEAPENTERALWERHRVPKRCLQAPGTCPGCLSGKGLPMGRDKLPSALSDGTLVRGKLSKAWCWGVTELGGRPLRSGCWTVAAPQGLWQRSLPAPRGLSSS